MLKFTTTGVMCRDCHNAEREEYEPATEIACPDCYGGHFRPCQMCGDSGRVMFAKRKAPNDPSSPTGRQRSESGKETPSE